MAKRPSREDIVKAEIQTKLNRGNTRLLRNNVGKLRTPNGGSIAFGLGSSGSFILPGTSDFIGWRTIEITDAMVGAQIAVFAAVEAKDLDDPTEEQLRFIAQVRAAGGLAGVAHSVEEAEAVLSPENLRTVTVAPGMVGERVAAVTAGDVMR